MSAVYIYDAIRTPRGIAKETGALHQLSALELLAQLYSALVARTNLDPAQVDDIVLGCVSQVGEQGGNIARASALYAGWPQHVPGMTLNRFCSSSLDACCSAYDAIASGSKNIVVTGGVESMSRVPMLADKPAWMIEPKLAFKTKAVPLGNSADLVATLQGYSRAQLDQYALQSQQRAAHARTEGYFRQSTISMQIADCDPAQDDETIRADTTLEQLAGLSPVFAKMGAQGVDQLLLASNPTLSEIDHQHTVANSPAMADGASLLLIANEEFSKQNDIKPRAEILAYHSCCGPVDLGLTGGIVAAQQVMQRTGLESSDLDLVEYNESFAGPTLKFIQDMQLDPDIVNVNGGAIALGHPMGATGGMLVSMLLDELERRDQELGLVSICGAAGSGTAMLVRRTK